MVFSPALKMYLALSKVMMIVGSVSEETEVRTDADQCIGSSGGGDGTKEEWGRQERNNLLRAPKNLVQSAASLMTAARAEENG